jgi:hypothetical protein
MAEFLDNEETLILRPVCGHDIYIIAQALHYAIAYIDEHPEKYQVIKGCSNRADMWEILENFFPEFARMFKKMDQLELGEVGHA